MTPNSTFDVLRRSNGSGNASGIYDSAAARGVGLGAHPTDSTRFALAEHNSFIGVLTRDVSATGLSLADRVFGRTSDTPVGLEAPFIAGKEVSVEKPEEMELEGSDYILLTGTGALSSATTIPQKLSYLQGRLRITQSGEDVNFYLTANNLPATDGSSLRIRVERA